MNNRRRTRSQPARSYSSSDRVPSPLRESPVVDTPLHHASDHPSEGFIQASVYSPCPPLPTTLEGDVRPHFERPLFDPDAPSKISVIARTLRSIPVYKITRVERFCDVPIFRVSVSLPPYGFQAEVLADSIITGRQIAATALMLKFDPMADISALPPFVLYARVPRMTRKSTTNFQDTAENPQLLRDGVKPEKISEILSEPPPLQPRNRSPRPTAPPGVSGIRSPETKTRIFEISNKTGRASQSNESPLIFYEDRDPDPEMAEEEAQHNLESPTAQPSDVLPKFSPQRKSANSGPMSPTTGPHCTDCVPSPTCTAPLQSQPIPPIATTSENREVSDQKNTVRNAKRPLNSPRPDLSVNRIQTSEQKPFEQFRGMSLEESRPSQAIRNETGGVSAHDFELENFNHRKASASSRSATGNVNGERSGKRLGMSNPKVVGRPFVKIPPVSSTTPVQFPFRTMTGSTLLSRDSTCFCGNTDRHSSPEIYKRDFGASQTNGNVASLVPGSDDTGDPSTNNKKDEISWTDSEIAIDITNTPLRHRNEPGLNVQIPLFLRVLGDYFDVDVRLQVTALVQAALFVRLDVRYFSLEEVPPSVKLGDNLCAKVIHVANGGEEELRSAMIFAVGSLSHTLWTERARHISLGYAASLAPRIVVLHNHPVFRTICNSEVVDVRSPQTDVVEFVISILNQAK